MSMCPSFLTDDDVGPEGVRMSKIFHVHPPSSALYPQDKAQVVAITFRSDTEVELKDLAVLKCQVKKNIIVSVYLLGPYSGWR